MINKTINKAVLGMTDNEIIKALGCCSNAEPCENCPYQKQCDETDLAEIALDLIKRQQAEIERLKKENTVLREDNHILATEYAVKAKSKAIKEFADRLKAKGVTAFGGGLVVTGNNIDNLLKEMEKECEDTK
jgi:hypothetical protein